MIGGAKLAINPARRATTIRNERAVADERLFFSLQGRCRDSQLTGAFKATVRKRAMATSVSAWVALRSTFNKSVVTTMSRTTLKNVRVLMVSETSVPFMNREN